MNPLFFVFGAYVMFIDRMGGILMRILVVGAGAVGAYFGGRLIEKGEDVTFLVRTRRKEQLDTTGLEIKSVHGDLKIQPKTITVEDGVEPYDVIILSTKAYHLKGAIDDIRPYVGSETMILPLLNGISHIDKLKYTFSDKNVIGGLCFIESTLDSDGRVIQTSPIHNLYFGERNGEKTDRIAALQAVFDGTKANFYLSNHIEQDMWHKYLFITTMSGVTSLFRSPIGPIRKAEKGAETIKKVLDEVAAIMRKIGAPIADNIENLQYEKIQQMGYNMKSSLQRDMEKQLEVESDHLYGYLLKEAEKEGIAATILSTIYANLQVYEEGAWHHPNFVE
jgi:2-dehydropantoate 2-reductase